MLTNLSKLTAVSLYTNIFFLDSRRANTDTSETTGYKGKIYGEPTRELHKLFGLTSNLDMTPSGEERKGYVSTRPYLVRVLISIWVSLVVGCVADVEGI